MNSVGIQWVEVWNFHPRTKYKNLFQKFVSRKLCELQKYWLRWFWSFWDFCEKWSRLTGTFKKLSKFVQLLSGCAFISPARWIGTFVIFWTKNHILARPDSDCYFYTHFDILWFRTEMEEMYTLKITFKKRSIWIIQSLFARG